MITVNSAVCSVLYTYNHKLSYCGRNYYLFGNLPFYTPMLFVSQSLYLFGPTIPYCMAGMTGC